MATYMKGTDSVAGSLAEAYVTFSNGSRYNLMQLINFESTMEIENSEVPILGKTGKGTKPAGWTGEWSGTAHFNQSVFRRYLYEYKKTGILEPFEIQVTNEDPSSAVGRQTIIHKGCFISSAILAKFDADEEILDEDIEGTFDDWEMPEEFTALTGA